MKIKETERLTGIPAANIRYYEKEGLLKPGRNKENNYREYSEEDVLRLQQIKVLRLLGITLDEIKELYMQEETLETVIEHRLLQIEEEETRLKEVRRTCENILQSRMDLESLDQSILDGDETYWKERLQKVLAEDMSKTLLDQSQFHLHIGGMLIWGYFLYLGMTLLTRDFFWGIHKRIGSEDFVQRCYRTWRNGRRLRTGVVSLLYYICLFDDWMQHCGMVVGENGCTDSGIPSVCTSRCTHSYDGDFFLCRRRDAAEYLQLPPGFLGTDNRVCPGSSCHPESLAGFFSKNKISGSGGNHRQRPDRFNRLVYDGAADHAGSAGYYIYHVH